MSVVFYINEIKFYLQLIKIDTFRKTKKMWQENGIYPSEPIFVPNPNGKVSIERRLFTWKNKKETKLLFSYFFVFRTRTTG